MVMKAKIYKTININEGKPNAFRNYKVYIDGTPVWVSESNFSQYPDLINIQEGYLHFKEPFAQYYTFTTAKNSKGSFTILLPLVASIEVQVIEDLNLDKKANLDPSMGTTNELEGNQVVAALKRKPTVKAKPKESKQELEVEEESFNVSIDEYMELLNFFEWQVEELKTKGVVGPKNRIAAIKATSTRFSSNEELKKAAEFMRGWPPLIKFIKENIAKSINQTPALEIGQPIANETNVKKMKLHDGKVIKGLSAKSYNNAKKNEGWKLTETNEKQTSLKNTAVPQPDIETFENGRPKLVQPNIEAGNLYAGEKVIKGKKVKPSDNKKASVSITNTTPKSVSTTVPELSDDLVKEIFDYYQKVHKEAKEKYTLEGRHPTTIKIRAAGDAIAATKTKFSNIPEVKAFADYVGGFGMLIDQIEEELDTSESTQQPIVQAFQQAREVTKIEVITTPLDASDVVTNKEFSRLYDNSVSTLELINKLVPEFAVKAIRIGLTNTYQELNMCPEQELTDFVIAKLQDGYDMSQEPWLETYIKNYKTTSDNQQQVSQAFQLASEATRTENTAESATPYKADSSSQNNSPLLENAILLSNFTDEEYTLLSGWLTDNLLKGAYEDIVDILIETDPTFDPDAITDGQYIVNSVTLTLTMKNKDKHPNAVMIKSYVVKKINEGVIDSSKEPGVTLYAKEVAKLLENRVIPTQLQVSDSKLQLPSPESQIYVNIASPSLQANEAKEPTITYNQARRATETAYDDTYTIDLDLDLIQRVPLLGYNMENARNQPKNKLRGKFEPLTVKVLDAGKKSTTPEKNQLKGIGEPTDPKIRFINGLLQLATKEKVDLNTKDRLISLITKELTKSKSEELAVLNQIKTDINRLLNGTTFAQNTGNPTGTKQETKLRHSPRSTTSFLGKFKHDLENETGLKELIHTPDINCNDAYLDHIFHKVTNHPSFSNEYGNGVKPGFEPIHYEVWLEAIRIINEFKKLRNSTENNSGQHPFTYSVAYKTMAESFKRNFRFGPKAENYTNLRGLINTSALRNIQSFNYKISFEPDGDAFDRIATFFSWSPSIANALNYIFSEIDTNSNINGSKIEHQVKEIKINIAKDYDNEVIILYIIDSNSLAKKAEFEILTDLRNSKLCEKRNLWGLCNYSVLLDNANGSFELRILSDKESEWQDEPIIKLVKPNHAFIHKLSFYNL